jgi:hypothetical protein
MHLQNESPKKVVRFPEQPDATEVIITFTRSDPNRPMSFQITIWACFELPTTTTPVGTTTPLVTYTSTQEITSTQVVTSTSTATSSVHTTECTISEGMDEPQFIPNNNIRDDKDDKVPKDVENLRPDSNKPFSVNVDKITLKIWFMPAVRLASIRLISPENVDSITVWYIKPTSRTSRESPVVQVIAVIILVYLPVQLKMFP